jgi:homoserine/homoserine lactone efflux protein
MQAEVYLVYLATVAVFFATPPGTSQILMISNSLRFGARRALPTAAGDLTANVVQMLAAGMGLAAIIGTSATALTVIKWLGVAYLLWFGIRTYLAAANVGANVGAPDAQPDSHPSRLFFQGFLTSAANPEAVFFFAALFPQFIDPQLALWPQLLILGATYLFFDGVLLIAFGFGAARFLDVLRTRTRLLNRLAGLMMIAAAALLGAKDVHAR